MIPSPLELYRHGKVIYDYLKDVKDAGNDQANLYRETVAMQAVLERLESHPDEGDWNETMEALRRPGGVFEQLEFELKRMERKFKATGSLKSVGKALLWHWSKDDVEKQCARIARLRGLLEIALVNNNRCVHFKSTLIPEISPKRFIRR